MIKSDTSCICLYHYNTNNKRCKFDVQGLYEPEIYTDDDRENDQYTTHDGKGNDDIKRCNTNTSKWFAYLTQSQA